jgi:hypothetical protein
VGITLLQSWLKRRKLVKNLLEPELVDLVNGDEKQLIVLGTIRKWFLK